MKTKHTPGKWATAGNFGYKTEGGRYKLVIVRGDRAPLNTNMIATAFGNSEKEVVANAKLIANAPELLEALKIAVEELRAMKGDEMTQTI